MADGSKIEWTDATWNPITGCSVVSPGCTNCYAMRLAGTRLQHHPSRAGLTRDSKAGPVWTGEVRFNDQWLRQPLHWKRPRMIFVCAHGDLFAEGVPDEWIDRVFAVMALAPQHVFQVLTKRPTRMRNYLRNSDVADRIISAACSVDSYEGACWAADVRIAGEPALPLQNVWLGVSAEDQRRADERVPILLDTPAAIRWVSAEPLLGSIDFTRVGTLDSICAAMPDVIEREARARPKSGDGSICGAQIDAVGSIGSSIMFFQTPDHMGGFSVTSPRRWPRIDWIVAGGESGPGARPMHPDWARSIRDQCAAAGVPFHFKQWGAWAPVCAMDDVQIDRCYRPALDSQPEATRRCLVEQHVLHADGSRHGHLEPMAFLQGRGAMTMMMIGKKAAGRLLDGVEHNGYPEAR